MQIKGFIYELSGRNALVVINVFNDEGVLTVCVPFVYPEQH